VELLTDNKTNKWILVDVSKALGSLVTSVVKELNALALRAYGSPDIVFYFDGNSKLCSDEKPFGVFYSGMLFLEISFGVTQR